MSDRLMDSRDVRRLKAGDTFRGIFVVSKFFERKDKNDRPYWDMTVMDKEGTLDAKIWSGASWRDRSASDSTAQTELSAEKRNAILGCTVGIDGKTVDFSGKAQLNFNAISLLPQEQYPPAGYVRSSPFSVESLTVRFRALIDQCGEPVRGFLNHMFSGELWQQFCVWPAAVGNHHAYGTGLLEHTVSVAEAAAALGRTYAAIMPVDMDVIIAGALLHDLGKLDSYAMTPMPEITVPGAVLDHIAMGYGKFMDIARGYGLDGSYTLAIAHILLSHHGLKEYGATVLPGTPEAMIVSCSDELDFRLFCWGEAFRDAPQGQVISPFNQPTGRRFWRGHAAPQEDE